MNISSAHERVQALADMSGSSLCCHSNKARAPIAIANLPYIAQLDGTPYHSLKLHLGPCSGVGMQRRTDRHTDMRDHYTFRVVYDSHGM